MQTDRRLFLAVAIGVLTMASASAQDKGYPPRVLAYQYLQKNQVDEAEYAFIKAMKMDPAEILNYRDLAVLYLTKGNYSKAESTAKAGLNIKPADIDLRSVLAKTYIQKGDKQNAVSQLKDIIGKSPRNIFAWYELAAVTAANESQENYLLKALSLATTNIVIRLDLAEWLIRKAKADSAIFYLQEIKKIAPEFSPAVSEAYLDLVQSLRSNDFPKAKAREARFRDLFKLTGAYIEELTMLEGPKLSVGYADFSSGQNQNKAVSGRSGFASNKGFTDATKAIGLEFENAGQSAHAVIAVTDYTEAGEMYLYTSTVTGGKQKCRLLHSAVGSFQDVNVSGGIDHLAEDQSAAFMDYNNDGYSDLFIATTKGILVYRNNGDGTFTAQKTDLGLGIPIQVQKIVFADFDQDGDLDLYASTKSGNKFFRNNGNGTFTEQANAMGLDIAAGSALDFSDYDGDGDLDIISASDTKGPTLLNNGRHSKFKDVTSRTGLRNPKFNGRAVAFADYDNDGMPDLFIAGAAGQNFLLKNVNGDHFIVDPASKVFSGSLHDVNVFDAAFLDYDNDGYEDLVVAGTSNNPSSRTVVLFHNDGGKGFSDASSLLPKTVGQVTNIAIADFNADGDDDLFLAGPGGIRLLRNDIGSLNHYMQVQLTGLSYGNSKNNRFGIGAQVELKAGDLYQLKTIKRSVTNFGLGAHNTLESARIIWPNGMPQYIRDPSANERIMEEQMLKGSCPFLFAWNGKKYAFVKDMMWRSAMGMPLAIKGKDTTYAFSDPSKEYLLIPGEALLPRNNRYSIKITEELWEAVYFDKTSLIAVDHPDSVNVFADEKFVAPPFPGNGLWCSEQTLSSHRSRRAGQ